MAKATGKNRDMLTARRCIVCNRPKGCIPFAMEIDGQMRSIFAHLRCFIRIRKANGCSKNILDVMKKTLDRRETA